METKGRQQRYVLENILVWVVILAVGLGLVSAIRRYGGAISERHHARALMDEAAAACDQGETLAAQRTLLTALARVPREAPEAVRRFNVRLLAMPDVTDWFAAPPPEAAEALAGDQQAAAAWLVLSHATAPALTGLGAGENGFSDPHTALWEGRLALETGRVEQAAAAFERYWEDRSAERASVANAIEGSVKSPLDAARALLRAGLWKEAFDAADDAVDAGSQEPDALAFRGLAAEHRGDPVRAADLYRRVLSRHPTHLLARERLRALSGSK